ncbi:FlaA1/EpsC-like NDP-sugar epimerase [Larkinella arboricola]|uniref:FlaA1/EpsC-like NDP-sugar epimerase n=1 Tax=Larkinella arboricola TaxID=643671 RepID=A0A327X5V8_LARAB|nr:nucleoside-diphosphate sugar epimerase/dehydratase [Larkinella arboricola]RAK02049.1 FlaA1/EpsC-like NDP-sugar epimerase [Larkinella arboricola]
MIEQLLKTSATRFVSSYLVLCLDVIICIISFVMASLLRFNFEVSGIQQGDFIYYLSVIVSARVFFFVLFRSYQGIIRHTSLEDVSLLVYAVTLSGAVTALGSFLTWQLSGQVYYYVPVSILLIDYFCCLVMLSALRLMAKTVYWALRADHTGSRQPVLIYGAGEIGLLTRKVLAQDANRRYSVIAFIDDNPYKIQKVIQGVKVISRQEAYERYIRDQTVLPQVVLAMGSVDVRQKNEITEFFLQYHVSVKTVPTIGQWIDGELKPSQIRAIRIEDLLERDPIEVTNPAVSEQLRDQVVLVTGAAGSIGSELVRQVLSHLPRTIVLLDQAESALFDLEFNLRREYKSVLGYTRLIIKIGDVADQTRMQHIFQEIRPDFVFHAAAYKHVPLMEQHPYEAVRVNVLGTQIVADLSVRYGIRKFVMISTDKAVNPTNVMGATKRLAEMYVQSLNHPDEKLQQTRFIATRFGNVLGSNGSVVTVFRQQIQAGGPVTVTHPDIIRYFMTIPEACQLVLEAGTMGKGGEVFVFDMGEPVRIADLARKMIHLSGYIPGKDINLIYTGLRPGEKLYEELLSTNEQTLPTHHPKIMIARVITPERDEISATLRELRYLSTQSDANKLVRVIKQMIPEYISNNSIYTLLDTQESGPVEV